MINKKKTHCQRLYQDGCLQVGDTVYIISTVKGIKPGSAVWSKELYRSLEFIPKPIPGKISKHPSCFKSELLEMLDNGDYDLLSHYIPFNIGNAGNDDYLRDVIETSIEWVPVVAIWIGDD
jgi:hypothetical protein